jgi:ankyrin repeat protein
MFAARMGDLEASTFVLDAGANINVESSEKLTALHVATVRGHGDVVALLLDRGANPNADGPGYTPLHWAVGLWETNMTGANGMSPPKGHEWDRLRGVQEGKSEIVEALLGHGADPNALFQRLPEHYGNGHTDPPKGSTSLAVAAFSGDVEMIRLLAEQGADPSQKSETGLTPLMIALGVGRDDRISSVSLDDSLDAARAVVELGVDVDETDPDGNTALHHAAMFGAEEIVQLLADNGADLYAKNNEGKTPLEVARRDKQTGAGPDAKRVRSTAKKLLRELGVPKTLKKSMDEWSNLPRHIRDSVESLLEGELEKLEEAGEK